MLVGHNKNVSIVHANEFQPLPKRPSETQMNMPLEEERKENEEVGQEEEQEERVTLPTKSDRKPLEYVRVSDRHFIKMKKRADDISRQVEQAVRLSQSPTFRKKRRLAAGPIEASFEESEGEGGAQGYKRGTAKKGQEQGSHQLLH